MQIFKNNPLVWSLSGRRSPYPFYFVSLLAVACVVVAAWFTQHFFEERLRSEKGELLTVVLEQTQEALLEWNKERQKEVTSWAQTYIIREAALSLLNVSDTRLELQTSVAQDVLREILAPMMLGSRHQGYFVISKEGINLASSRDANIADVSVISPEILGRVLAGESVVTLPQPSKIILPTITGSLATDQPTMFSLAPIKDEKGNVSAILAFRLDALRDFSSILHLGNIGQSGETYVFDEAGKLLCESRFLESLWSAGLLEPNQQSTFNLQLRDPGGNMIAGYRPGTPREQQPLTLMASSATKGENGLNLKGYNDYRGVPVIGTWRWNEALGYGIATEIDVEEAYATLLVSRFLMIVGAALSILIIFLLNVVFTLARWRVAKSEASLVNAQRMAHLGSWDWDFVDSRLEWSDETYRIFRQDPDKFEVSYENLLNIIHPDDRETVIRNVEEALDTNKAYAVEHRIECPDGTERIVYEQATIERDAHGKPIYMHGSVLDITDRKKAEQELTLFKTTSDMIEDSVFMFDPETLKFFYVNQAAIQQVGYSEEELLNMTPLDITPNFDLKSFRALIDPLIKGPDRTLLFQTVHQRITGSLLPVDIALQYLAPKDESARFVAVVRDFTKRQRIENQLKAEKEKAEQATRYKSEFLANMSHEIRTPMNGVLGMLELLETTQLDEKQNRYLRTAESSAKSLLTVINDILDFSKIEAGRMQLENTPFNLHKTVEDSISAMSKQAEDKHIELNCYIPSDVQSHVIGDPLRLRQIITNLISNAIKFTASGEVNLRLYKVTDGGKQVSLGFEVEDTGVGVEEDKLDSLFDAFTQADGSITRKYGGSGLGLSICRQLVSMMGGTMSVSSKPGTGSIFSFSATFPKVEHVEETNKQELPNHIRVLVVDSNDTSRQILSSYLSNWNIQNTAVGDVHQVLPLLHDARNNHKPYQIVLIDFQMPQIDGMTLPHIIKHDEELQDISLIMLGSSAILNDDPESESCIERYLTKPVRQSDLYNAILEVTGLADKEPSKNDRSKEANISFNGARVLLVDDVATNQAVGAEMLNRLGIDPVLASDGRAALREVKNANYDLVFMDCQMPVMDGQAATEIIRAQEHAEGSDHLPIIALTANAMKGDKEACIIAGMDDYLSKPITMDNLRTILCRWLPEEMQRGITPGSNESAGVGEEVSEVAAGPVELPESAIDSNAVDDLRKLAGGRFSTLIDSFERDVQKNLAALRDAVKQNNAEAVVSAAHAMKGAGLNMAAMHFSDCCKTLETQARNDGIADAPGLINVVENEYQRALSELRELC